MHACPPAIAVRLIDRVESAHTRPETVFRFKTLFRERVGGRTLKPGTMGYGIVRDVEPAGRGDRDGEVVLEPRFLQARGAQIPVAMSPLLPVAWAPRTTLVDAGMTKLPVPVALPAMALNLVNGLRWGRNVTLGRGFNFSVIPLGDLTRRRAC